MGRSSEESGIFLFRRRPPIFIIKAGEILESQGKKDEALKLYQDAKKKYVNAMLVQSGEIDKYIERASN